MDKAVTMNKVEQLLRLLKRIRVSNDLIVMKQLADDGDTLALQIRQQIRKA